MVAHADPVPQTDPRDKFLQLLPKIRARVEFALRGLPRQTREDLIDEAVIDAFVAFMRLAELGKLAVALPTPLADYAVKRTLAGRRVGCQLNRDDVSSFYGQRSHRIRLLRLDRFDGAENCWKEVVVEDRSAGPDEIAAARIDLAEWFRRLPRRNRKIAQRLALGDRTRDVAKRFGLSRGRISQLRREFEDSWNEFQGEAAEPQPVPAAA
jgi:hypothetical protein